MSKHNGLYCTNGLKCQRDECTEQLQLCRHDPIYVQKHGDLYDELVALKEQNALLTVQVQGLVSIIERIDSHTDSTNDGVTHDLCQEALTALPQQVKSEDARDADFDLEAERIFTEELTGTVGRINPDATCIDDIFIFDDASPDAAISAQEPKG